MLVLGYATQVQTSACRKPPKHSIDSNTSSRDWMCLKLELEMVDVCSGREIVWWASLKANDFQSQVAVYSPVTLQGLPVAGHGVVWKRLVVVDIFFLQSRKAPVANARRFSIYDLGNFVGGGGYSRIDSPSALHCRYSWPHSDRMSRASC